MSFLQELLVGLLEVLGLVSPRERGSNTLPVARTADEAEALLVRLGDRMGFQTRVLDAEVSMQGLQDGLPVWVTVPFKVVDSQARFHLNITVESSAHLLSPWTVYPREVAPRGARALGDARLDPYLKVVGEEAVVAAAVDPLVRDLVLGLSGVLDVRQDRLSFRATRAATFLEPLVAQLVTLAKRLALAPAVDAEVLLVRFRGEPLPDLRERCLTALLSRFPDAPQTIEAARRGLYDVSARVRLRSAQHLGQEGQAVLQELASASHQDPGLRLSAARNLPNLDGALVAALESQARQAEDRIALTAIRILGRFGPATALPLLSVLMEAGQSPPRIQEAARQAAERLQARFPSAGLGHLSLVDPEPTAGRLSVSEEEGALSLDE